MRAARDAAVGLDTGLVRFTSALPALSRAPVWWARRSQTAIARETGGVMFGTQHTLKRLFGGIAIAAFLAVVAVPSAFAGSFITDTLGGNGYPKATPDVFERAVARHEAWQLRAQQARSQAQGMRFITDTLGGNGYPATKPSGYNPGGYVNGGMSPEVAKSIQAHRYDPSAYVNGGAAPSVAQAIQDLGNGV